jgi:hypothetical protein
MELIMNSLLKALLCCKKVGNGHLYAPFLRICMAYSEISVNLQSPNQIQNRFNMASIYYYYYYYYYY